MEPLFLQRTSRITRTVRKSSSLRTTIPEQVAEFLKLVPGDSLEWTVRIQDSRISVYVRRLEVVQP
jgi:bifunctional DNA-binding transcriptional regulator/antitoxin component of YhaV-PrlF toxin-antitoxin module